MLSISLRYIPGSPTGEEIMGALLSQSIHGTALWGRGLLRKGKTSNNKHDWTLVKYLNILLHNRTQKQL